MARQKPRDMVASTKKSKSKSKPYPETVISDRIWNSEQSWYRERIIAIGDQRIRFYLRCNAYKFQSYAEVELWRGSEWSQIHRIAGMAMATEASYADRTVKPSAFDADIAELRRVAGAVLGAE
jgi:hypothetical protein